MAYESKTLKGYRKQYTNKIGGNPTIDQLNKPGGFIYNAICNENEDTVVLKYIIKI